MNRLHLIMMTMLLALAPWSAAGAQVTIDVAKITCDQFTLYKVTDPQNIAIWLSGYYHGQRNDTMVDTMELATYERKVKDYCNLNPQVTVMQAVESMLKPK
jgi:acid stress chaperone HdeB